MPRMLCAMAWTHITAPGARTGRERTCDLAIMLRSYDRASPVTAAAPEAFCSVDHRRSPQQHRAAGSRDAPRNTRAHCHLAEEHEQHVRRVLQRGKKRRSPEEVNET